MHNCLNINEVKQQVLKFKAIPSKVNQLKKENNHQLMSIKMLHNWIIKWRIPQNCTKMKTHRGNRPNLILIKSRQIMMSKTVCIQPKLIKSKLWTHSHHSSNYLEKINIQNWRLLHKYRILWKEIVDPQVTKERRKWSTKKFSINKVLKRRS